MNLVKPVAAVLLVLAMLPAVWGASYNILVQESGNSIVIATLEGAGLHTIELPVDAQPEVRGALYLQEGNILSASVGSTEKAVVAYQTSTFTFKENAWKLSINLDGPAKVSLPLSANILSINPQEFVKETDVKTIEFPEGSAEITYQIENVNLQAYLDNMDTNKFETIVTYVVITALFLILLIGLFFVIKRPKKVKQVKTSHKNNVLKTLSSNEKKVVQILIENNNEAKRSLIERESRIAKSSLASTLSQLENKKLVEVDRDNTTHFVKLQPWFVEL
ncbi:hypothetical protein KY338_04750 [Candidatus Woesearchaeota archaeon]|nr:hypothetical protein [Candidatus Woesearchaeota archaeon]MBW3006215.1 hypothetical protein [Candidatus Woesearchaeota archaeon]